MDHMARCKSGEIISFYHNGANLYYKTWHGAGFSEAVAILSDVLDNFTVNLSQDDTIYIFCQAKNGDIILCTKQGASLKRRIILENTAPQVYKIKFSALACESGLTLVYNSPTHIVTQRMDKNGVWHPPVNIDNYIPLPKSIYMTQNISSDHILLYYMTAENKLAYRELNSETFGRANIFYSPVGEAKDFSFLVTENSLHMLFIMKTMFSQQLLYRRKNADGLSGIRVVWEGRKIDGCLLFESDKTLYLTFNMNNQLYIMTSTDDGAAFSRPSKYKENFARGIKKASYQSAALEKAFCLNDIYVSKSDPTNLKLITDFCPNFFPAAAMHKAADAVETAAAAERTDAPIRAAAFPEPPAVDAAAFNRLQTEYNRVVQQNAEKDRRIEYYKNQAEQLGADVDKLKAQIAVTGEINLGTPPQIAQAPSS